MGKNTEKLDTKKKPAAKKVAVLLLLLLVVPQALVQPNKNVTLRLKSSERENPITAQTMSCLDELADIPNLLCIPERPCTKGSIQVPSPKLKGRKRRRSLELSQKLLEEIRTVIPRW
jgi:hypothetical protein